MSESPFPRAWDLVRTPPADGVWNMACDLALMGRARDTGRGILRVYGWASPTMSFGRNERTQGLYGAEALAEAGFACVRRPTGGRALLHDQEITYSVSMPLADERRWTTAYDAVNALLAASLVALGVPARIAVKDDQHRGTILPDGTPCFAGVSPGEIEVGGSKLVASAVWRERGAYLQHGSILLADHQHRIRALNATALGAASPAALLRDHVTAPTRDKSGATLTDAFASVLTETLGSTLVRTVPAGTISGFDMRDMHAEIARVAIGLSESSWLWRR
jgi:lipoate-protein ligase A